MADNDALPDAGCHGVFGFAADEGAAFLHVFAVFVEAVRTVPRRAGSDPHPCGTGYTCNHVWNLEYPDDRELQACTYLASRKLTQTGAKSQRIHIGLAPNFRWHVHCF